MSRTTQKSILLKVLRGEPDKWFFSYELIKDATKFGWLGTSIDGQARKLARAGVIQRREQGQYVQFKASPPKEVIPYYVQGELVSQKIVW